MEIRGIMERMRTIWRNMYVYTVLAAGFMTAAMFSALELYPVGSRSLAYSDGDLCVLLRQSV